ncbi:tryptophan-rich sensory protein [Mucilaginibacter rubeus]|uniref:Tryptophan-rich sensory protein n=1 Tax=Mucilaginibacter rubeus TaxID=2027860 RepID=A0AAE6JBF3_9SPHI|nr:MULTISPECIES: TspO/MBR family protein [Mucilaginibacter]QEM02371.1 tryptophan-rich sensory protein [Mucilaginibacter rubeus]QEM14996.1 tryptophan-rich sensory protein [Mucilaginibacter gossypii]QTE42287.1 tryptophan-rich sensory protein [Mucilaginibacter rubeus]QTE48888.1 tryptophan-rich sensory protein [Mucilaginibacter rubeus]QTE53986.1 tryptophan-rich sensory protein [Mucilaginibacter rubeus]
MSVAVSTKRFQFFPYLISLLIVLFIGFVASLVTRPEIAGWYSTLKKPSFNPPPWLFAPVWTAIYIMIATAAYLVWKHRSRKPVYIIARSIYFIQLILNFSWSIVFFGMHQIAAAAVVIILLWLSIVVNINWFNKFSRTASWLLVPYLLWVSFASILNMSIYFLNR